MSTTRNGVAESLADWPDNISSASDPSSLHCIRHVRLREGIELRAVARRMGGRRYIPRLRHEEDPNTDLKVSDLHRWQRALSVPLTDLLTDDDRAISSAVVRRAQVLRLMKTVMAIYEQSPSLAIRRMAESMITELRQVMPELIDVAPWYGRELLGLNDYGRIVEHTLSDSLFTSGQCQSE